MIKKLILQLTVALFLLSFKNFDRHFPAVLDFSAEHEKDQLILEIAVGSDPDQIKRELFQQLPLLHSIRQIPQTPYLLAEFDLLPETQAGRNLLSFKVSRLANISRYSLNYRAFIAETLPNDQYFNFQYWLKNSGQLIHQEDKLYGTSDADIKATAGWDYTTGTDGVVVAVVDTGLFFDHEDLKNKFVTGYDFVNDRIAADDDHGHGTAVSAVITAESNNGIGIAGVCWKAKIMPLKAFNKNGSGTLLAVLTAIRYAADKGAQIINLGLTLNADSPLLEEACKYAYEKGAVLIAAAGNNSGAVSYPAAYDNYVLAVSATDENDIFASFSNYGPQIDLAAPGRYIISASFNPANTANNRYYTYYKQGTSFSAAMVSGAAALLLGYKPFLKNQEVYNLLRYTADDINKQNFPGKDIYLGYGRLNLKNLLEPYQLKK